MGRSRLRVATMVGLFVALGFPFVWGLLRGEHPENLSSPSRLIAGLAEDWIVAFLLLLIVLLWERESLGSIGIGRLSRRDLLWGVGGFLAGALSFVLTIPIVKALGLGTASGGITQLAQLPLGYRKLLFRPNA